ncbi:MAG: cation transporter [Polyangiaceae bacterium]|nr:cation transporter [Polyangiaceae bacterium]
MHRRRHGHRDHPRARLVPDHPHEHEPGHEHAHEHEAGHEHEHEHAARAPGHAHGHDHRATPLRRLAWAFGLTASFMLVEAAVGFFTGSRALVADAGHMLSDSAALGLAIAAQRIAVRDRTRRRTYGFRRAEVLAAFVNGIALALVAVWVCKEAVVRWAEPPEIAALPMLATAVAGLVVNAASAFILSRGSHNPNTRAAFLHVLSDGLGSVGAIAAGAVMLAGGSTRADAVASAAIGLLVLYGGWRLLRDTAHVLMEGTPVEIDVHEVEATLRQVPGVADFHDLHVWSISEGFNVLTVHVVIAAGHHGTVVAGAAGRALRTAHGIAHTTIQPEAPRGAALVTLGTRARRAAADAAEAR